MTTTQKKRTVENSPMKAIRKHCIECSGGSSHEVKLCVIKTCPLYNFRFGKRKNAESTRAKMTAESKAKLVERLQAGRKKK